MVYALYTSVLLGDNFLMVSQVTQMEIVIKNYAIGKLMYQFTTLRFTKLFYFDLIRS